MSAFAAIIQLSRDGDIVAMGNGKPGFGTGANFHPGTKVKPEVSRKVEQLAEKIRSRDDLTKILVPYVRTRGIAMLDQWLLQCISAKSDANAPAEDESKSYWAIALIGNLVWAATCFIPGAGIIKAAGQGMSGLGKAFYAGMAIGGATVGSGTVQQTTSNPDGSPTGKDAIADMLNDQRTKLGGIFDKMIAGFVSGLYKSQNFDPDHYNNDQTSYLVELDHALWSDIFPGIPFEGFKEIYESSLKAINKALIDFNRQYKDWAKVIAARVRYAFSPRGDSWDYAAYTDAEGRTWDQEVQYQMSLYRFKPKLNFYG